MGVVLNSMGTGRGDLSALMTTSMPSKSVRSSGVHS